MPRQFRAAWLPLVAAVALSAAGCLPSIADLNSGPLNQTFAVSDFFAPSGYMGDGEFFGNLIGTTNEGCKPRAGLARGNCYAFTYYPNNMDLDPWAGVFWVFPANSWGSTSGRAINIGNFKQISFWAAIDGPTPYTVGGNPVPFVGQAGGIDPHGNFVDKGELEYVDGVNLASNGWPVGDPTTGITTEMKQFHIDLTDFNKGAGCQEPMPTNPDGTPKVTMKAPNCTPNAAAQQMGLTPEQAFQMGLEQATFVIGAFAWALHYPIDIPQCSDASVDCHQNQHSSMFVNPPPVHIYLDDLVWDTDPPPGHPVKTHRLLWAAATSLAAALVLATPAFSGEARAAYDDDVAPAPPSPGPELNPFECYGRYQYATENRTIAEMQHELKQRLEWLDEAGQPDTVYAIKLCVIAKLKARIGDADAWDWYERSLKADPVEPGLELWAAQYWTGHRGVRRPIAEPAEVHYYAALRKLEAIKKAGRWKEYHTIVEDWVRHDLTVLYQMDGLPILPFKAYPQHSNGLRPPGISIGSQLRFAKDTRDFFFNNEYRQFTGEMQFANSDIRQGGTPFGQLDALQKWNLVRAPLRLELQNKVRIRQNPIGTFDFLHGYLHQWGSQVYNFYNPTNSCRQVMGSSEPCSMGQPAFSDIQVQQIGAGYERVFPLYPVFDLRLAGTAQRVWRDGIVEFHPYNYYLPRPDGTFYAPNRRETLNLYEFKPSISRFLGADKLVINGVWAMLDSPQGTFDAPPLEQMRRKVIRAVNFEYGLYQPLVLPTWDYGRLSTYRTPTRGLYFFGGVMEDGELWGTHQVTARDYYGGIRFEGPHWTDWTLQETYETTNTTYGETDGFGGFVYSQPGQAFSSARTTFVLQYRVRSADTFPGMPPSHGGFGSDMFHLVFPFFWDKAVSGPNDFENVRAGGQIWTKLIGEGIGGTTFLITAGIDYQYFYRIEKGLLMGQLAIRMGWGDL